MTTAFKNIDCTSSSIEAKTSGEGGAAETIVAMVETLSFESCNCAFKTLKGGALEIHWISGTNNGTLTWSGTELTTTCSTIFGAVHCIYATNATDVGTITGGASATIDIPSAGIPRLATNSLCDEGANWDAEYTFSSPKPLYVTGHT